jgi:hypothetical protein
MKFLIVADTAVSHQPSADAIPILLVPTIDLDRPLPSRKAG